MENRRASPGNEPHGVPRARNETSGGRLAEKKNNNNNFSKKVLNSHFAKRYRVATQGRDQQRIS